MDNNKIYVSEQEYARLCRLDGKMDALIGFLSFVEGNFVDADSIKAIIGMEDDDNCLDVNAPEIIIGMEDE